jgi:hypothetical protein
MRISPARPAPLVLGLIFVFALAWQAWGAFIGDSVQHAGPAAGGGGAFGGDFFVISTAGDAVSANSTGGGFELRGGRWHGDLSPTPTAVGDPTLRPTINRLVGAHPNPFNPRTEVSFELAEATRVRVDVHDVRGRLIRTLIDESRPAGSHAVTWNGKDNRGSTVASGTYYLRFVAGDRVDTRKVALLK